MMMPTRELSLEGRVMHQRSGPPRHSFSYPIRMLLVDVERANSRRWRFSPVQVGHGHLLTPDKIAARLRDAGIDRAPSRSLALTQPRSFGISFNPVNFYFCFAGQECFAIIAEVHNTPWNERYCYVHDVRGSGGEALFDTAKAFHVSPFLPMQGQYLWRFRWREESVHIDIRFCQEERPLLHAALVLRGRPLDKARLWRGWLSTPAQTLFTLLRIYWQAAMLWRKGARFYPHPGASPGMDSESHLCRKEEHP